MGNVPHSLRCHRGPPFTSFLLLLLQSPVQKAKRQQMDMLAELKKRQMVKEPLIYEGKDGAIEDIITGEVGQPLNLGVEWELDPTGRCLVGQKQGDTCGWGARSG